ncbi:lactate utilization protein C [Saccharomonospora sp. CUA-673]|uniref:LutC/YkgG family protein n=1 Tax=Saccharomonospora sp. CUA-673 TaxID=1904969 RepID=UPI00095A211E|nr:LUD domain-containing protein [Saccharomonospora sp. CUA-673]OLT45367.1 lactate utilization protein C [Saccharomonospora sp. CUA-673]
MADAREEILGRIRGVPRPATPDVPRDYDHDRGYADVVALFDERITDYRAHVHRVGARELPYRIGERLDARGRIVVPADVPGAWRVPGVDWAPDDPRLGLSELDSADGVLTGCALAIAETGTIVLDAGAAQGRRMLTLVPDYHLCVVRAEQIVGSVPEAIAALEPQRPLTFISGPSATSDIELDRVEGVHGPRTLEVLLVS